LKYLLALQKAYLINRPRRPNRRTLVTISYQAGNGGGGGGGGGPSGFVDMSFSPNMIVKLARSRALSNLIRTIK
jgi:hypothetical protein